MNKSSARFALQDSPDWL